ncbi:MAG: xanthine dehydrogenase family protein subunit M, partial [Pseudomonadota bacterium]
IPPGQEAAGTRFEKLGARRYLVISIAMVASLVERSADGTLDHVRVSVGACSAVAQRLPDVEAALAGVLAEPGAIRARLATVPLDALCPLDDVRGSAAYRMDAARELIARAVISAADEPDPLSDDSGRGIAA